jgi:hypothetical protein
MMREGKRALLDAGRHASGKSPTRGARFDDAPRYFGRAREG